MTRADDLKRMLDNARHPGESMKAYRNRRVLAQASVDKHLKGRLVFESTKFVVIPAKGTDPQTEEHILRGQLRDVQMVGGKRVARTKGKTYRKEATA
jgi:hypothetical protein